MRDVVRSVVKPVVRRAVRAEYAFRMTFNPGVIPAGLVTTIAGARFDYLYEDDTELTEFGPDEPTITYLGLQGDDYTSCEVVKALDLSEGEIIIDFGLETIAVPSNLLTVRQTANGQSSDLGDEAVEALRVNISFGTPPAWWLTAHGKPAGTYMQINGTEIQDYAPGMLTRISFYEKAGAGEKTGIKKVQINKKARWV